MMYYCFVTTIDVCALKGSRKNTIDTSRFFYRSKPSADRKKMIHKFKMRNAFCVLEHPIRIRHHAAF